MATTVRVKVLRPQQGDKRYERGDFRTLPVADAERLAETGAVEIVEKPRNGPKPQQAPKKRGTKKAAAPANKKAPAPANKAEG